MSPRRLLPLLYGLAFLVGAAALIFAPINQDEGWYLLAARRVASGALPYRDFAFTQAPLLPFAYQLALPLVDAFGLAGGRGFSLILALATLGVVARTARRHGAGSASACLAVALLGLNVFQAQYTATVKTYGAAGLLLAVGCAAALERHHRPCLRHAVLAGLALAAATATRISLVAFLLPVLAAPFLAPRESHHLRSAWAQALAAALGLALFFLPFLGIAPEGLRFGLIDFHTGRDIASPWLLRAGFLSRVLQAYFPALLAAGALVFRGIPLRPGLPSIAIGIGLVSLVHLFAPFPYDDYQAALYPALVLLLAIELPRSLQRSFRARLCPAVALGCLAYALASPQLLTWAAHRQDRIWWRMRAAPDLIRLREAAHILRLLAPPGSLLLTQDTYLAVEAGLDVPQGLELGPFSYFPDLDDATARRLRVINRAALTELLSSAAAPVAALSGYSLTIASPGITELPGTEREFLESLLALRYEEITRIADFGQGSTTLRIFRRR